MLRLSGDELKRSAATTLMSTDITGVELIASLFNSAWASALEVCIGIYGLCTVLGPAGLLLLPVCACEPKLSLDTYGSII